MPAEALPDAEVLAPEAVDALIGSLAERGFTVVGPTVRDGAIVLDEIGSADDLPVGWTDEQEPGRYRLRRRGDAALFGYAVGPQAPRRFLTPPRRVLWEAAAPDGNLTIRVPSDRDAETYAFVGLRPCELAALRVADRVHAGGAAPDHRYRRRRERTFVVAVDCGAPASTCFCASMGAGPSVEVLAPGGDGPDVDLVMTEVLDGDHRLVVTAWSPRGREILDELAAVPATAGDVAAARAVTEATVTSQVRRLDPEAARDVLASSLEHPRWDHVAERCLSCTNCTMVCPTCFCVSQVEVSSLDASSTEHVERWESCFSLDHSYVHGVGGVRADIRSRYRQWLTHKLSTWWQQFDTSGCVGCGRCITWCPVGIDLVEEVAAMSASPVAPGEVA